MSRRRLHRAAKAKGLVYKAETWCGIPLVNATCAVLLRDVDCKRCLRGRRSWTSSFRTSLAKWLADEPVLHPLCDRVHRRSEGCDGVGNVPPVSP